MFGVTYPGQMYPAGYPLSVGAVLGELGHTSAHPLAQERRADVVGSRETVGQRSARTVEEG